MSETDGEGGVASAIRDECWMRGSGYTKPAACHFWKATVDGSGTGHDQARDLVLSEDGETVIVAGQTVRPGPEWRPTVVAFDAATGERSWTYSYEPSGNDGAFYRIAQGAEQGEVYAVGVTEAENDVDRPLIVALDTADGEPRWSERIDAFPGDAFAADAEPVGRSVILAVADWDVYEHQTMLRSLDAETGAEEWTDTSVHDGEPMTAFRVTVDEETRTAWLTGNGPDGARTTHYDLQDQTVRWGTGTDDARDSWDLGIGRTDAAVHRPLVDTGGDEPSFGLATYEASTGDLVERTRTGAPEDVETRVRSSVFDTSRDTMLMTGMNYVEHAPFVWELWGGTVAVDTANHEVSWKTETRPYDGTYVSPKSIDLAPGADCAFQVSSTGGHNFVGEAEIQTSALRVEDGERVWSARYDAHDRSAWPEAATVADDGSLYVIGETGSHWGVPVGVAGPLNAEASIGGDVDWLVLRYDPPCPATSVPGDVMIGG